MFAVVLFHVWIWVLEPLPTDYWAPAKDGWTYVNSHFGIRMPLLLLVSGCLASRAIRSGIRAPKVHLRIATHYYLYVVWLGVLTLFSFTLPAGDLPHRIGSIGDALGQLLVPDTPLWYVMALAVFTLVLALVARVPPWLVLSVAHRAVRDQRDVRDSRDVAPHPRANGLLRDRGVLPGTRCGV